MIKIIIVSLIFLCSNLYAKQNVNIDFTAFGKENFQFTLNPKRYKMKFISATILIEKNILSSESDIKSIEIYNSNLNKKLHFKPMYCCDKLSINIKIPYNDDLIQQSYSYIKNGWYGIEHYKKNIHLKLLSKSKWYQSALPFFSSDSQLIIHYENGKSQIYSMKFKKSFNQVVKEFENEYKSSIRWNIFWIVLTYLVGLIILIRILKIIIPKIYNKTKNSVDKLQKNQQNNKIKRIEEDEIIRANIKKTINKEQQNEFEDLQEMINKALAKGDTETAQELLKILNKQKSKL